MMKSENLIHRFPELGQEYKLPEKFTFPFCYTPAAITKKAAGILMDKIDSDKNLSVIFSEGKMLGVLTIRDKEGKPGFLAGFSGLAGGKNKITGFVPPILDLLDADGHFKKEEKEISAININISEILNSCEMQEAHSKLENAIKKKEESVYIMKERIKASKSRRHAMRASCDNEEVLSALIKESQFEKASLKRLVASCDAEIHDAEKHLDTITSRIEQLKKERAFRSEALQRWIFINSNVENALGTVKNIMEIFEEKGLVPPGGTGECAAPKLLHYAYTNGLKPIAMGEFWYCRKESNNCGGKHQDNTTETRLHGRFYPSCTGKCGPLLGFMLSGLDIEDNPLETRESYTEKIRIIYEDCDIIAADKPSGILSVPGKTGTKSVQEILEENGKTVFSIHRLDMETSGVLIFAKNYDTEKKLRRQFEERQVQKEYIAILDTANSNTLKAGQYGTISLPVGPDFYERPRQKVDLKDGKEAITEYEVLSIGQATAKVLFKPLTGRTHQLRIHSAHPSGLGCPILGDRLYGSGHGANTKRLYLHAMSVVFRHPSSGEKIKIAVQPEF